MNSHNVKRCSKCKSLFSGKKIEECFQKNKNKKDGLHNQCRNCRSTRQKTKWFNQNLKCSVEGCNNIAAEAFDKPIDFFVSRKYPVCDSHLSIRLEDHRFKYFLEIKMVTKEGDMLLNKPYRSS